MANALDEIRKRRSNNDSTESKKESDKNALDEIRENSGNTGSSAAPEDIEQPEYVSTINDFIDSYNAYASGFGGGEGYVSPETTLANKNNLLALQSKYEKALAAFNENMDSFANVEQLRKLFDDFTENYRAFTMANRTDRMYYDQWADEGEYNRDIQAFNEYAELKDFDVAGAEEQLELLKEQRAGIGSDYGDNITQIVAGGMRRNPVDRNAEEKAELDSQITALAQQIALAKRAQNAEALYSGAVEAPDFEEYSFEPEIPETKINPHQQNIPRETESERRYMTDEQRAVYNYYYNKFGKAKAEEYYATIADSVRQKRAEAIFEGNEGNPFNHLLMAGQAGLEQSKAGFQGAARMVLGDDSYQPRTEFDYYSEMAKEDLADFGAMPEWIQKNIGIQSLGTLAYDMVQTGANMAPSIAFGMATAPFTAGLGGAMAIGASAGGNTYEETLREGFSAEQARNYALLSGASEAVLSSLLSGIGALGGKLTKKFVGNLVDVDGVLKRIAKTVPIKLGSEGLEEYLQEIFDPIFRNAVLDENNEINLLSPDALYSFILGALSSAGFVAGETAIENYNAKQTYSPIQEELVEKGLESDTGSVSYVLATIAREKLDEGKNLSGRELRKLEEAIAKEQERAKATAGAVVAENATVDSAEPKTASAKAETAPAGSPRVYLGKTARDVADIRKIAESFEYAGKDTPGQIAALYNKNGKVSAEEFSRGISEAYRYGASGISIEEMNRNGSFVRSLEDYQRTSAYYLGQNNAEKAIAAQAQEQQKKVLPGIKGKVVLEGRAAIEVFDDPKQTSVINFVDKVLSKVAGMEYHIFSSFEQDGKRVYVNNKGETVNAPNGWYNPETRQIWIDLHAGSEADGKMLYTLTHEHVHDIKVWSAQHYNKLVKITAEAFSKSGKSFEEAVAVKLEQYRKNHPETDLETAREEVVAETMSGLLQDGKALAEFSEQVYKQDRTLWEKIKDWFKDIIGRITAAYKDVSPESEEARMLLEQKELFEEAQKVFAEAVVTAGQNYRKASEQSSTSQVNKGDTNAKFQVRNDDESQQNQEGAVKYDERQKLDDIADRYEKISNFEYLKDKAAHPLLLVMEETPQMLVELMKKDGLADVKSRKILIRKDALYLAIREEGIEKGHYHNLGAETLKQLPDKIKDPDVVLKTDGKTKRRLLLTHVKNSNGEAVISIEFEAPKEFEGKNDRFNIIVTVFDLHKNYLKGLFNKHDAIVEYEKEDLTQVNPQLYEWLRTINVRSSKENIAQPGEDVKYHLREYSPEEKEQHVADAKNYFGTTYNWKEAGYLLPDGRRLDFSGRHEGAPGGYRTVDHRDITDALGEDYGDGDYSGGMVQFMSEGNIRISPESGGINLSVAPTKDQYDSLSDFISRNRGEVILDLDDLNGNTISSTEYPRGTHANKVIADIKAYFAEGKLPQGSESATAQFRYQDRDSAGNELSKEQAEYFKDSKVRDEDGNLLVMYHGTPNAGFTKFRGGTYFTQNKEYAEIYKNQGASSLSYKKTADNPDVYAVYLNIKKPFDTRNPRERRIFMQEFYGQWGNGSPLADSGLPDWVDGMDLQEFIEEKGYDYDGLILDEGATGGYGEEVKSRGLSYVVFFPEQVKNFDNKTPTENPDIRYSLRDVEPVQPSSDKWKRTATTSEVMARFPDLWNVAAEESETRNPTQITGTVRSYRKIYDFLKNEGFDGKILDASSGLGYGTRAGIEEYGFDVEDIEPYPDKSYRPKYKDYSKLHKKYDVIISNAVLNVIPQEQRDALVSKMGELLNEGGRMFINVRGKDVENASSKVAINEDLMEYYISSTGSYQKGFTKPELVAYLQDALGNGFDVKATNMFGAVSAVVTKKNEDVGVKYSLRPYYWEPTLDKEEWRIINYVVENHQGVELTEKTDYFYRNYKGKILFGIYSTDDDTLLYAVHKKRADEAHKFIREFSEVYDDGKTLITATGEFDSRFKSIWLRQNNSTHDNSRNVASGRHSGNDTIYGRESGFKPDAALRNVLKNLFEERQFDEGRINYQERLSVEDRNRLSVLGGKKDRLSKELAVLEKEFGDVIREAYKQNVEPDEGLSEKAEKLNAKAAYRLMSEVASVFHVPKETAEEFVLPIIAEMVDKGPAISESEGLFEKLLDTAYNHTEDYIVDNDPDGTYKNLRNYIRRTPLFVDSGTKADIGDYNGFRKHNMGSLNLVNDAGALSLEEFYDEVANIAPEFFSHSSDGAEQLYELSGFMKDRGRTESIGDFMPKEEFVSWAEDVLSPEVDKLFDSAVGTFLSEASRKETERKKAAKVQNAFEAVSDRITGYDDAIKEARAEGVLAGQMSQGKAMAKEMRHKAEAYEKAIAKKKEQISEVRARRDELLEKARKEKAEAVAKVRQEARDRLEKTIADVKAEKNAQIDALREKHIGKETAIKEKYRDSIKKATEGRHRTLMRGKIKRVVGELNDLLLHGGKERHVPEHMKGMVARALAAIDLYSPEYYESRIKNLIEEIANENDLAERGKLKVKLAGYQMAQKNADFKLSEVREEYQKIANSDDPVIKNGYDPVVAQKIEAVAENFKNTSFGDMSISQLEQVYELFKMLKTSISKANELFGDEKKQTITETADKIIEEIERFERKNKSIPVAEDFALTTDYNNLKPVYFFERLGSPTLKKLFRRLRDGEDTYATDVREAFEFVEKLKEKYHFSKWDMKKTFEFKSFSGKNFELTVQQMMSIYAYSKRDQAYKHLTDGGFVFDSLATKIKKKLGIPVKYKVDDATPYNIDVDTIKAISENLTDEQRAFADEMQTYLSEVMGAKGNEVSMEMYDIKLFKEKDYFPLKTSDLYNAVNTKDAPSGMIKLKNSGFTKERVPGANNPIVLSDFMDVWANHVNDMSMYHAFVLPIENFGKILNFKTPIFPNHKSVEGVIQNAFGGAAVRYIEQLIKDINGNAVSDSRENVAKALTSRFKKAAVSASLSVVIQQPSALVRACAVISPKYFAGLPNAPFVKHKSTWEEVKKYAPVAFIKEMGHFDMNTGRGTVEFLKNEKGVIPWIDKASGFLPSYADEFAWNAIWYAVKRETKAKNPELNSKSEEFLKICGERFTEVIIRTQVYDSTLSRSANMRSSSFAMSMFTAFMAEPTTSINMLEDAVLGKDHEKNYGKKAALSVASSVLLNSILVSFVYAARDDDEDETYWEKYLSKLTTELIDGINPLTYFPILKDMWSIMQGYDVERMDMSLFSKFYEEIEKFTKLIGTDTLEMSEEEKSEHRKNIFNGAVDLCGSVANFIGMPMKNLVRDVRAIANLLGMVDNGLKNTATSIADALGEGVVNSVPNLILNLVGYEKETKQDKLYDAIIAGDETYLERIRSGYKDESSYTSAVRKALKENDPRIEEAARLAAIDEDYAGANAIAKEIIGEGNFDDDVVFKVIADRISAIKGGDDETASSPKNYGMFNAEQFVDSALDGDKTDMEVIRNDFISKKLRDGKTQEEAEKSFKESVRDEVKDRFESGEISAENAAKILAEHCELSSEKAEATVDGWEFKNEFGFDYSDRAAAYKAGTIGKAEFKNVLMEHGGLSSEEADIQIEVYDWQKAGFDIENNAYSIIRDFKEFCEPSGIDRDIYFNAYLFYKDSGKEGVSYSKTKECIPYIDALPLTPAQKTALALCWWSESTVKKYKTW